MGSYFNEKFQANLNNLRTVRDYLPLFASEPLAFEPAQSGSTAIPALLFSG
jgi:hypothetical protein